MKLRVENLANIKEAEVNIKNLTLFVGQNSTHKSYMAHTVYELYKEISSIKNNWNKKNRIILSVSKNLFSKYEKEISELLLLEREISENIEKYPIDDDDFEIDVSTIVKIKIENNKTFIFLQEKATIFILEELTNVINSSFNSHTSIIKKVFLDSLNINHDYKYITLRFNIPMEFFEEEKEDIRNRIINNLVSKMITKFEQLLGIYNYSYYFPASRTGFVLTLDEIYAGIFRDKFRGQVSATRLSEPTIDFIQTFADIKTGKHRVRDLFDFRIIEDEEYTNSKIKELTNFLETNIIKGKIKEIKTDHDYTNYYLEVNNKKVDLHLSSSATLETLPFIVFIKNTENIKNTFFVIEEPEAHLHPKAQIQMAKFLVLLSNAGAKVLVTTHSDYILNEINNCIKLSSIDDTDSFSISQANISAYLFKNEETHITVNELTIDKFGISNENFDEVLDELLERSDELNEKILSTHND